MSSSLTHPVVIASYAGVGEGVLWMLVLLLVASVCLAWIAFWIPRRFRDDTTEPPVALKWWLLRIAIIVGIMACFPPLRRVGVWREAETNRPIPPELALQYDRHCFGYIPSYGWIGRVGVTQTPEFSVTIGNPDHGRYRLIRFGWTIDWLYFTGQVAVLVLFLLPYIRAKDLSNAASG